MALHHIPEFDACRHSLLSDKRVRHREREIETHHGLRILVAMIDHLLDYVFTRSKLDQLVELPMRCHSKPKLAGGVLCSGPIHSDDAHFESAFILATVSCN